MNGLPNWLEKVLDRVQKLVDDEDDRKLAWLALIFLTLIVVPMMIPESLFGQAWLNQTEKNKEGVEVPGMPFGLREWAEMMVGVFIVLATGERMNKDEE